MATDPAATPGGTPRSLADLERELEAARQALSMRRSFLAQMSHEIRTPMHGILGLTRLLLDTPLSDAQAGHVNTILAAGTTLMRIIGDLLDLSKIEAGKLAFEQRGFDLREVLGNTEALFGPVARQKGLTFHIDVPATLDTWVSGDPVRLQQVLGNLVSNALKFTDRGEVSVELAELLPAEGLQRQWRFIVRDTGIGIPADRQSALFQPFEQSDASVARRFGGTGLGLAIVKQLVEAFGGSIGVVSDPGRGTTFSFTCCLGRGPQQQASAPSHATGAARVAGLRVLVVDDNPVNLTYASAVLEHQGCELVLAENGAQAVERWLQQPFDLVLMDCFMPVMDGFDATRSIRRHEAQLQRPRTPVIAVTASAFPEDHAACLDAGMDDLLSKPFGPHEFVAAVARWCEKQDAPRMPDPAPRPLVSSDRADPAVPAEAALFELLPGADLAPTATDTTLAAMLAFQRIAREHLEGETTADVMVDRLCHLLTRSTAARQVTVWAFTEHNGALALRALGRVGAAADSPTLRAVTPEALAAWMRDGHRVVLEPALPPAAAGHAAPRQRLVLESVYGVDDRPLGLISCELAGDAASHTHGKLVLLHRAGVRTAHALKRAATALKVPYRHPWPQGADVGTAAAPATPLKRHA